MTARAPIRVWLALALLCCALGAAHARADAKRGHADDPLADTDTGEDDLTSASSEDRSSDAPADSNAPGDDAASGEPAEADAPPATPGETETEADAAAEPSLQVEPFFGGGLATRGFERPTKTGAQRMGNTVVPALDAGLRMTGWPNAAFSLGVLLHYQTSLGMSVQEQPPFALDNEVGVRSEHVELSAAPTFRLGDAGGLAVAFPIGFALRTFWPEVHHLMTPGYSLGGPLLRAELVVPLRDVLVLRIGPEFQWFVMIDHVLTDDGMASQAVGIGGEATLALRLSALFALLLHYRESHALAPNDTEGGQSFSDVERYLTLGLSGRL